MKKKIEIQTDRVAKQGTLNCELWKIVAREAGNNLSASVPRVKKAVHKLAKKFNVVDFDVSYREVGAIHGSVEFLVVRAYRKRANRTVGWHKAVLCRPNWMNDGVVHVNTMIDDPFDRLPHGI